SYVYIEGRQHEDVGGIDMRIGMIGAGAIAQFLLKKVNGDESSNMEICSVLVRNREKYIDVESQFDVVLYEDLNAFLESGVDVIVEAANVGAARMLVPPIIKKKDMVVISIGAFADGDFYEEMNQLAVRHQTKVHLPSGAIGGLDLLQNAHVVGGVTRVALTTRKPAHSLTDKKLSEKESIFSGTASEAIKQFPKNINVSIILSIAGLGVEKTSVNIIADPTIENNIHTIEVEGDFGEATFTVKNYPLAENPNTSHLAAMSVLGTLNRMQASIRIGE